ncbi:MAG: hypothetical protein AB7E52_02945 [Bdellovibrionales bacterium]
MTATTLACAAPLSCEKALTSLQTYGKKLLGWSMDLALPLASFLTGSKLCEKLYWGIPYVDLVNPNPTLAKGVVLGLSLCAGLSARWLTRAEDVAYVPFVSRDVLAPAGIAALAATVVTYFSPSMGALTGSTLLPFMMHGPREKLFSFMDGPTVPSSSPQKSQATYDVR